VAGKKNGGSYDYGNHVLYEYGISRAQWMERMPPADRAAFAREVCAVCGREPRGKRLSVDHRHVDAQPRAALCGNCNAIIGHAREDPAVLRAAIAYLGRWEVVNNARPIQYRPRAGAQTLKSLLAAYKNIGKEPLTHLVALFESRRRAGPGPRTEARAPAPAQTPTPAARGISDERAIAVVESANPYRPGSAAAATFEAYRTGDTVSAWKARVAAIQSGSLGHRLGYLGPNIRAGHIVLLPAQTTKEAAERFVRDERACRRATPS
jgi:hypothetical protein